MHRTTKAVSVAAALLTAAGIGCTDPTVVPKSTVTSANVFNDPNSYRAFLAKIYSGLIVTGQRGPDGNADIAGIDEGFGEYLRLYWYLQEMPVQAQVFAEALVDACDVRIPVRTALSGDDQPAVDLCEERPIRVGIVEHVGAGNGALRHHRRIGAADPGRGEEGGGDAHCLGCAVHVVRPPRTGRSGRW